MRRDRRSGGGGRRRDNDNDRDRDRGQAYTLEGLSGALLVLIAFLVALQSVVVTPTTPGTVDRASRDELDGQVRDVLQAAHANGTLTAVVLGWNESSDVVERQPAFDGLLDQSFRQRGFNVNVYLEYRKTPAHTASDRVAYRYRGQPTDNAVAASLTVGLVDDMYTRENGTDRRLDNASGFYAPDVDPAGPLYNVVTVEVVVW